MTLPAIPIDVERLYAPVEADARDAVLAIETGSFANPWTASTFDSMLQAPVGRLYVARTAARRIIGFCSCWVIDDELHINTLAVQQVFRRQGVASSLLGAVLERTGVTRATLEVRRSNTAALALYEKFGFRVTAVRPGYYTKPEEDALILWLNP